jgi:hypothetical protein
VTDISHSELYEIAGSEFAVDCQIEQGEFPAPTRELQPNANGPNLFKLSFTWREPGKLAASYSTK